MKILVLGASGMLGNAVLRLFAQSPGYQVLGLSDRLLPNELHPNLIMDVENMDSYGLDFDVVVSRGHMHGVQCHPEKSHHWGEQLLKNFVEL